MEIQSAFNSGIDGFNKATDATNKAAADIVAATTFKVAADIVAANTFNDTGIEGFTEGTEIKPNNSPSKVTGINQSIVDLKVSEYQVKASADVISTADENLGTLLDVRV